MVKKTPEMKDFEKTERFLILYLVQLLLPESKRGKWTSFDKIMSANGFINSKIPAERVFECLTKDMFLFWERRIDWKSPNSDLPIKYEFCIDPNAFFSIEERGQPNFDIYNFKKPISEIQKEVREMEYQINKMIYDFIKKYEYKVIFGGLDKFPIKLDDGYDYSLFDNEPING